MPPEIVSFTASETEVYVNEKITFTSTKKYSDADVEYYVDGVKVGAEWTPDAAGTYTVEARLTDAETKTVTVTVKYVENIYGVKVDEIPGQYFFILPGEWESVNPLYAVEFINKNTDASYKVQGFVNNHVVSFCLVEGAGVYTHLKFIQYENPTDLSTTQIEDFNALNVLDETEELTWDGGYTMYDIDNNEWAVVPTALDRVEATAAIRYANGVVVAEGAIEVYNVNGMVVARGNETIDLRNLAAGVYIVRNGNNVRKVVR